MVSIKDVARRAGVSVGTVSNVINRPSYVSPDTRARVTAAIDELGFVRSESARQLRVGRSRTMALLVLDIANPFFVDVARGAERVARGAGLGVMLCNSGHDPNVEAEYLSLFAEQRVRGALITPADANGANVESFKRRQIPFVMVDRVGPSDDVCSVSIDDEVGGELAVRHLIRAGHTQIVYANGPSTLAQCRDRQTGAERAIAEAGLPPEALTVIEADQMTVASGRDAGSRLLGLASRPTAVFCVNDLVALGVLQAMFAAGVRVPDDVAIVGYDDIEFAAAAAVPLTSVRQPAFRMGQAATELLLEEAGDEAERHQHRRVVFQPELVVRASSPASLRR
ncbi:LacI family DNA-binding transcriptional regulator [Rugosimonospora acidiphila]|uniref:LacI family DNA-binding transcriptional regulator n=1 Tax=Rugosimonospora acidiphila TaxID=556531 RepID=A0ABP9S426_9ACTN